MRNLSEKSLIWIILALLVVVVALELFTKNDSVSGTRTIAMPKFQLKKAA